MPKWLRLAFGAAAAMVFPMLVASVPASADTTTTVSAETFPIPTSVSSASGTLQLNNIACETQTSCFAIGIDTANNDVGLVPVVNGTAGAIIDELPVPSYLEGIACPSASLCLAVGTEFPPSGPSVGAFIPIVSGVPGAVQVDASTTGFNSIKCQSVSVCIATGVEGDYAGTVIIPFINGQPQNPTLTVPSLGIDPLVCPTQTLCYGVGVIIQRNPPPTLWTWVIVTVTNNVLTNVQPISNVWNVDDLACTSPTQCEAVGFGYNNSLYASPAGTCCGGVVIPVEDGVPGTPTVVPDTSELHGIACMTSSQCEAVGWSGTPTGAVVVPIEYGTPLTPLYVTDLSDLVSTSALFDITCSSSTTCLAVGYEVNLVTGQLQGEAASLSSTAQVQVQVTAS